MQNPEYDFYMRYGPGNPEYQRLFGGNEWTVPGSG